MDVIAEVCPGACGLVTHARASSPDGMTLHVGIESECPRIEAYAVQVAARMPSLDALDELLSKSLAQTSPVLLAAEHGLQTTCLVPVAVLKAAEVAAGLALPQSASTDLERAD